MKQRAGFSSTLPVSRSVLATFSLASFLALLGCSADYNGERLFWNAQRLKTSGVTKNLNAATPQQFAKAIDAFEQVMRKTPGTVWAARSQLEIGSLYALQKEYGKARQAYGLLLQNYNRYTALSLDARLLTAKTYEAEGNWDEAIKSYKDIADYHPWSPIGLEAPLYIAQTYDQRKDPDSAIKAYDRALRIYTKLVADAPTPELGIRVKSHLALVHQRLGQWSEEAEVLESLLGAPKATLNRPVVLLTLASIYQTKISNPKRAREVYDMLIKEFPNHPLGKVAKAQMERLELAPASSATTQVAAPTQTDPNLIPATQPTTPSTTAPKP